MAFYSRQPSSSSSAPSSSSSSSMSARFSTLKAFKFTTSSSFASSPDPADASFETAPPPPPKDSFYLPSRPLRIVADVPNDTLAVGSIPSTPRTPDIGIARRPSPVPSQSAASLRSFAPSLAAQFPSPSSSSLAVVDQLKQSQSQSQFPYPYPSAGPSSSSSSTASSFKNALFQKKNSLLQFASLGKRAPRSSRKQNVDLLDEEMSPPPDSNGDDGITRPFNFQHNVHVDEGYSGLPSTWEDKLSSLGYSEAEIAAIQARRGSARSPNSQYLYEDRPRSPLPAQPGKTLNSPPIGAAPATAPAAISASVAESYIKQPLPRTTSLPRPSDASMTSSQQSHTHPCAQSARVTSPVAFTRARKPSIASVSAASLSLDDNGSSEGQYVLVGGAVSKNSAIGPNTGGTPHLRLPQRKEPPFNRSSVIPAGSASSTSDSGESPTPSAGASSEGVSASPSGGASSVPPVPPKTSGRTRTPPRTVLRVMNDPVPSPGETSPPPAYRSASSASPTISSALDAKGGYPRRKGEYGDEKVGLHKLSGPGSPLKSLAQVGGSSGKEDGAEEAESHRSLVESEDAAAGSHESTKDDESGRGNNGDDESTVTEASRSAFTVLLQKLDRDTPPRLSLRQDSDISSWTESLFEAISPALSGSGLNGLGSAGSLGSLGSFGSPISPNARTTKSPGVGSAADREQGTTLLYTPSFSACGSAFGLAPSPLLSPALTESSISTPVTSAPGTPLDASANVDQVARGVHRKAMLERRSTSRQALANMAPKDSQSVPPSPAPETTPASSGVAAFIPISSIQEPEVASPDPSESRLTPAFVTRIQPPLPTGEDRQVRSSSPSAEVERGPPFLPDVSFGSDIPTENDLLALASPSLSPDVIVSPPSEATVFSSSAISPVDTEQHHANAKFDSDPELPATTAAATLSTGSPLSKPYEGDESLLSADDAPGGRDPNRDSNMSTLTVTTATIVNGASIARMAVANVIDRDTLVNSVGSKGGLGIAMLTDAEESLQPPLTPSTRDSFAEDTTPRQSTAADHRISTVLDSTVVVGGRMRGSVVGSHAIPGPRPRSGSASPHSSYISSSSSSSNSTSLASPSASSSSPDFPVVTPPPKPLHSRLSLLPSPLKDNFAADSAAVIATDGYDEYDDEMGLENSSMGADVEPGKIEKDIEELLDNIDSAEDDTPEDRKSLEAATISTAISSLSSVSSYPKRYPGWVSEVVAPLQEFIDVLEPRDHFADLQEIAEGESGSVFSAHVSTPEAVGAPPGITVVAIKIVPILPQGSPKLMELQREMRLMRGMKHEHVLMMDALYVDLAEDSLWIRMELMERSLADVVSLVSEGLALQERMIARFASDVLLALEYLQKQGIAHRDVRSDNLLLNKNGVVKLADFSNAVRVTPDAPTCSDIAGVIYWQAPEIRQGPYDPLKVDAWSLGATVWELAQTTPPFSGVKDIGQITRFWPPLSHPELYSRAFHEFLRLCSHPASARPSPARLSNTPFIRNACGRAVNIQLLSQCRAIEEQVLERDNAAS